MRTFERYANAAKVVALCLPPVIMSLAGLAALSRKSARPAGASRDAKLSSRRDEAASSDAAIGGPGRGRRSRG